MEFSSLMAISPVDGRYRGKVESLQNYFSEFALIKYRVKVEVEYYITLAEEGIIEVNVDLFPKLRAVYENFTEANAQKVKDTEKITNHDVKAVEYFVKDELEALGLEDTLEFVHFGLTSQDINNTSVPLSLKDAVNEVYLPMLDELIDTLKAKSEEYRKIPMLAKTHGQPASPTRLGKEIYVFVARLEEQRRQLIDIKYNAKFGGATGNFNAHFVAYPQKDWLKFGEHFVNGVLGLTRSNPTTQIEHYDNLAALFDVLKRINTIILDLDRDMWTYISMEYFKQKIKAGEVGSSAMPHKVNPIDFENSEGNIGIANAVFEHLSAKLPVSRLQRDLTDSTVLRNIGVPFSHTLIAFQSTLKGLSKILLNEAAVAKDLEDNWAVVAEAIQTVLRRENFPKPYEALKGLTRTNTGITEEVISEFVDTLDVSDSIKAELKQITPHNYTGIEGY